MSLQLIYADPIVGGSLDVRAYKVVIIASERL